MPPEGKRLRMKPLRYQVGGGGQQQGLARAQSTYIQPYLPRPQGSCSARCCDEDLGPLGTLLLNLGCWTARSLLC